VAQYTTSLSNDFDFNLTWPDAEDLLETLMASESTNQGQVELGILPTLTRFNGATFETASSFHDKGSSIGAIPCCQLRRLGARGGTSKPILLSLKN
jgi:hypothetical protein